MDSYITFNDYIIQKQKVKLLYKSKKGLPYMQFYNYLYNSPFYLADAANIAPETTIIF